ncbi:unnamed protein product [Caenorhabditis auriculariae]|uniref:Uncharacterized protein n=1 Tax=Caenorhabditis auriculariae TaxID=2777116 RepID=A0A8S1HXH0_9PELO|nr:unnamed protein product [Caenorhabditis auriculariae]
MSRRFVSENARRIQRKFKDVHAHITSKYYRGLDMDTQEVYNDALIQSIEEIDVRGHNDPTILSPNVNNRSSTLRIVRRLERQINALCILADIAELGPEPNADEARVLSRGEQLIDRLYETISPEVSLRGSDTDSN